VRLERIEPRRTGGYRYEAVARAAADPQGRWVLKHMPAGWHRVVAEADGFLPRVAGHDRFHGQPRWAAYDCGLARPGPVSGRVTDDAGRPLADVEVRFQDVVAGSYDPYGSPDDPSCRTGVDGRFHSDRVAVGHATICVYRRGYCRPGLGLSITTPAQEVKLSMLRSAGVRVVVEFAGENLPGGYLVEVEPEGGAKVGQWGGRGVSTKRIASPFRTSRPGGTSCADVPILPTGTSTRPGR
jgi:hypothetical protein